MPQPGHAEVQKKWIKALKYGARSRPGFRATRRAGGNLNINIHRRLTGGNIKCGTMDVLAAIKQRDKLRYKDCLTKAVLNTH